MQHHYDVLYWYCQSLTQKGYNSNVILLLHIYHSISIYQNDVSKYVAISIQV